VKTYKPLVSSAPAHSILNAQAFDYTNSVDTDIRRTFARIARNKAVARAVRNGASNVQPLPKRPLATPAQQRPPQA
jgi:hypothetical protein